MFENVKTRLLGKKEKPKNLAVFIDGPNILRRELHVDLKDIKHVLQRFGQIKVGKVFLNQYASDKLMEAVVNQGFESVITVGNIDVAMAVEAMEAPPAAVHPGRDDGAGGIFGLSVLW